MNIAIKTAGTDIERARTTLAGTLGFGRHFTDLMFRMSYTAGTGWHDAAIGPYEPISLAPSAMVLHYGQEIFEGQKAYRWPDGRAAMFRPDANARRLNTSARRLCMPEIPVEDQVQATFALVNRLSPWIPPAPGALYVRPTMIATEGALGVRPANEYLYFIICSPVGPYFTKGFAPVRVKAEPTFVRAIEGGTGDAKCGGNYAGSLLAYQHAVKEGYEAVLWLDGKTHEHIEEIGAMNILAVVDGAIVTSPLTGTILPGVTRDSILHLARHLGLKVDERRLTIDELTRGIEAGTVSEAFGAGTAAVITPIGTVGWLGRDFVINGNQVGPITQQLYTTLTDYQYGRATDPFGWMRTT